MSVYKKYIDMVVRYYTDGTITPLAIWWDDGVIFQIDKIIDVRPCASLKAGGAGIRYTCMIQGHEKYIWLEENRWFVEAKGDKLNSEQIAG